MSEGKIRGRINNKGMGGFLNPPNHPEHDFSIAYRGGYSSLSSAAACDWLDDTTRAAAQAILDSWNKLPLDAAEVILWVRKVLGYFEGCYGNPDLSEPEKWHASNLLMSREAVERNVDTADNHAGVRFIQTYYPEYDPTD